MIIEKNGKKCSCGKSGCFETYSSMKALKNEVANVKKLENVTGKELYEIIANCDNTTCEIVEEFIQNLCIGMSNLIQIFHPKAICIGGSFVYFKDLLLDRITQNMYKENFMNKNKMTRIITAKMRK